METTFKLQTVQKVIGLEETPSTQCLARQLAQSEADATLVLACHQTEAIGRDGTSFYAGEGGVYFTLILNPQIQLDVSKITLAMTNAISDVITHVLNLRTKITPSGDVFVYEKTARKWKKCAGILTEQTNTGAYLVGAGIYLNNRLPVGLRTTCVSLKNLLGSETSKELFLDEVLNNFWKEYVFI